MRDDTDGVEGVECEFAAESGAVFVERSRCRPDEIVEHFLFNQVLPLVLEVADHEDDDTDGVESQHDHDIDERVVIVRLALSRQVHAIAVRDVEAHTSQQLAVHGRGRHLRRQTSDACKGCNQLATASGHAYYSRPNILLI